MTENIPSIDPILEISKEFNAAAERAAQILTSLDYKLQKAGIGTPLFLRDAICTETAGGLRLQFELGYDKTEEGWAICVRRCDLGEKLGFDRRSIYPLRSASRRLRLEMIKHVPRLLEELHQKAEEYNYLARSRRDLLDTLEKQAGPPPSKAPF